MTANTFTLSGFTGRGYDRGRGVAVQIAWLMIRGVLARWWVPVGVRVSVLRLFGADIGTAVNLRHGVRIHWPWKLTIGDGSWIGEGVWILNLEHVTIGANTCISQDVLLCTGSHDRRSPTFEFDNAAIHIGDTVWLAARSSILRGVSVGDGSTIGACALVTRDVVAGSLVLAPRADFVESSVESSPATLHQVRDSS
ncbi:MAG: putative colanic acid biosynthesis acetyltransferase [Gordonia sp. (in: high G+C Gram-positive bacteria)]